jgi:hypothetical protein
MTSLELYTDRMSGFMVSDKPSSFYNYYVELHLPVFMWCFYFWRENEAEGQDFIPGAGAQFWHSRELWMVVIYESIRESSVWRVGQILPLYGVYRFESPRHSRLWVTACPLQSSRSMVIIFWLEYGGSEDVGYDYVIRIITVFTLPLPLTFVNFLLLYTCSSL